MSAANTVDKKTVEAMLQRGRTRMVQALLHLSNADNTQRMFDHWQGFANCAAALLSSQAAVMASHDQASDADSAAQAALSSLPDDLERLSFADMKRLVRTQSVDLAVDTVTHCNLDAVVQLQDGVRTVIKFDDKHAVAGVDVQDGGRVHSDLPVEAAILTEGGGI